MAHTSRGMSSQLDHEEFLIDLEHHYGPLLGGDALRRALGYPSSGSLRQAYYRQHLPVPVFKIPRRRGLFALTRDVGRWLGTMARRGESPKEESMT